MNSKERVLRALSFQEPDSIPCDYMGTPEANLKLMNYFGTDSMDNVLEKLGVDLRVIEAPYIGPELRKWEDGRFENYWGQIKTPIG